MAIPGPATFPGPSTFPGMPPGVSTVLNVNPNWPLVGIEVDFTQGPPNLPGGNRKSINAAYRKLGVRQMAISRGRQYELDLVQAGTATLTVVDPNEYLNADNTASPFNSSVNTIIPYRAMQIWATWPNQPGSGNILTGLDPSFESGKAGWTGDLTSGTTIVWSTTQHFDGTHSLAIGQHAGGYAYNQYRTAPGVQYTFSCYLYLVTAGSQVAVTVYPATGPAVASTPVTTLNTWTRVSVTWTSVDTMEQIRVADVNGALANFYLDASQLEFGPTASAFTLSGPTTYNLFTGYVERWPTTYDMGGTRALRPLVAVDALAMLSRTQISQSYVQTVAADRPALYVPYNDAAPANLVLNQATVVTTTNVSSVVAVRGTQDVTAGGTANWGGDTFLDGSPAVSLSLQNTTGATTPVSYMSTDIPHAFSYPVNTAGATFEGWLKWTSGHFHGIFFGYNPGNTGTTYSETWGSTSNTFTGLVFGSVGLTFYANTAIPGGTTASTTITGAYAGSSGTFSANDPTNFSGDGQWHYYAMVFRPNGSNNGWVLDVQVDANVTTLAPSPAASGLGIFNFNQIMSETLLTFGDTAAKISVANVAYYPTALTLTQRLNHYNRGIGYLGERSGARVTRLLQQYWSATTGAINVATGQLSMAPDFGYDPPGQPTQARFVLDVLQEIQESERGLVYVDRNGVVVFEDRASRASTVVQWVLGENPAGASPAEYPYSDYQADFDPTYTFSQANLTRPGNSNYPVTVNTTTQARYGQRVLTQQVQVVDDYALSQAATFYLNRYANPKTRINKVTLNPAGNPNLWPVVLGMEISQQVTINRRTSGATVSASYHVERIALLLDFQNGMGTADLQVSPVFTPSSLKWVLGTGVLGTSTVPIY